MEINLISGDNQGELIVKGKLDSQNAPGAQKIFDQVASRFDKIILNLANLDYTSSAGLRVILKLQMDMESKGGDLYIKGVTPVVMEVFELTGSASFLSFI